MGTADKKLSDLVDIVRSWILRRSEPPNVSRDFWMPDQSCRVCYECDTQFTVFNHRHHCRLCGRIFCAKCTANSVPAPSDEPKTGREDWERIRVCNYCFKQWKQDIAIADNGTKAPSPGLSPSPSETSLASTKSSCTCISSNSTVGSTPYSTGPYHHVNYNSGFSPRGSAQMNASSEQNIEASGTSTNPSSAEADSSSNHFVFCGNRSDDEDDDYGAYRADSESRHYAHAAEYYGAINMDEIGCVYGSDKVHPDGENLDAKSLGASPLPENFDAKSVDRIKKFEEVHEQENADKSEAPAYDVDGTDAEPVDFENNGLPWLPPEPEDEEDEREAAVSDDDDDDDEGATGEWGYLHSSNNFSSGEYRSGISLARSTGRS